MSEFTEFRQPSALTWTPEVSGTWLAYESQDTHRKQLVEAHKPAKGETKPVVDVTSARPGDTLNFSKDEKGYFFFKVSGDDNYARHYFDKAQKWARLETLDSNGHRRIGPSYDLELQRKNVDQWLASQKPVAAPVETSVQPQPSHLEVTPAFKNVEQQRIAGKPLLPDQYHHVSNLIESMNFETGTNQLSVLRMIAGLADKAGNITDEQIGATHDYLQATRNPDPKLRLGYAVMLLLRAAPDLLSKDENGEIIFSVKDNSPASAYVNAAVEQLDEAVKTSDSLKAYADYGRTNNQARNLKAMITFVKISLDKGFLKFLNGRPLPELLP